VAAIHPKGEQGRACLRQILSPSPTP
jgi:hypothetical protein